MRPLAKIWTLDHGYDHFIVYLSWLFYPSIIQDLPSSNSLLGVNKSFILKVMKEQSTECKMITIE